MNEINELEAAIRDAQETLNKLKAKQQLATTMNQVTDAIQIELMKNASRNEIMPSYQLTQIEKNKKKVQAYKDILNLCLYLNDRFSVDGEIMPSYQYWTITRNGAIEGQNTPSVFTFNSYNAAKYALEHFAELFKTFYS
jgi:hypothetical protein